MLLGEARSKCEHIAGVPLEPETAAPSNARRRRLILDMGFEPHAKTDLPFVSTRVAQSYAGKTSKMLTRDLNALTEEGLLVRTSEGLYRANREIILAFLPGPNLSKEAASNT